ncbi:MAG: hypothetical protein CL789_04145 [Chloroflexi bacterium]|nr:hypothetical protein [Chloroflexota bacterium]
MDNNKKAPSNAQLEQLVPSTAVEFYTSSRMGWAELDDELIDSSITAGLLMNQLIVFERQHIKDVYHWTIYVDELRKESHIGTLTYRQVDKKSVALAYGIVPDHYNNKELMMVLRDAVITAKLKVDADHKVGIFHPYEYEAKPWDKIDADAKIKRLIHDWVFGHSMQELAKKYAYASKDVVKSRLSTLRKRYGEHVVPKAKNRVNYLSHLEYQTTVDMSGSPDKLIIDR